MPRDSVETNKIPNAITAAVLSVEMPVLSALKEMDTVLFTSVALAVLALPESLSGSFWSLALWGGLAATAVEYAVHVLYDRLLGVRFWDYSQVRWNLRGRVCLPFSLAWSLLVAAGLPVIQAAIAPALAAVPPTATYAALLVFTADTVVSLQLLRRAGDPAVLSLGNLRAA